MTHCIDIYSIYFDFIIALALKWQRTTMLSGRPLQAKGLHVAWSTSLRNNSAPEEHLLVVVRRLLDRTIPQSNRDTDIGLREAEAGMEIVPFVVEIRMSVLVGIKNQPGKTLIVLRCMDGHRNSNLGMDTVVVGMVELLMQSVPTVVVVDPDNLEIARWKLPHPHLQRLGTRTPNG